MRFTLFFICFVWLALPAIGQSQFAFEPQADVGDDVAYVHLLHKVETGSIAGYRLRTIFAPDEPLRLAPNSYTLLKVSEEYVGFFANYPEQTKPLIIDLEHGKHYFFRFTRLGFEFNIDELTQREFEMELFFNNIDVEPKRTYELGMPGS